MNTEIDPMATKKRDTTLNMYPVESAPPEVHALYARCRAKNISMRQLCISVGIHHDVVARWRRGEAQPTLRTMRKLLDGLATTRKVRVAA
jgi:predicted transcriptional regulator